MDETSRHAGEVNRDGNGDGRKAKSVLRIRACLTASIAFAFLSVGSAQTQSLKPLKFGHCQVAPEVIAVWIANELGIFQKYRLKVELTHVAGATLGQAMAAGEIPIGFCAGNIAVSSVAHGGDLVVVAGVVNHLVGNLWVVADSPIHRVQDLRGKAIAISAVGSLTEIVGRIILEEHGMSTRDVTLRPLGNSPARLAALERGVSEAAILLTFSPGPEKRIRSIYAIGSLKVLLPVASVLSTRRFIQKSPGDVEAVIKALVEAVAFINKPANKDRVIASLREGLKLKSVAETMPFYETTLRTFDSTYTIPVKGMEAFIAILSEKDPAVAKLKAEDTVDGRFVSNLEKSGFFKGIQ